MSTASDFPDEKRTTAMSDSSMETQSIVDGHITVLSPEQQALAKSARRKLDRWLIPVMTMFYLLSYLDRTNIGNARVVGLEADLGITPYQYQIALTILYVPYICTELPSNLVLKKIGPHRVMPTILTLWGVVVIAQGFVKNYSGLLAVRFMLGLLEGPMFPGIVLYLSGFYTRKELSFRVACFFSSASLAGAFSGLLAAAITKMNGVQGLQAWRWIFILEGLFTAVVGIASFWLVPPSPQQAFALTQAEKDAVAAALKADRPPVGSKDKFNAKEIVRSITSPHVFLIFVVFFVGGAIFFGIAFFLPSIIRGMAFSPIRSQLLSVPPFALAFVISLVSAWVSDRYNQRAIVLFPLCLMCLAGWIMFYAAEGTWARYGSFFLIVPGVFASSPIAAAWVSNNSEPYYRRASSIAWGFMATNGGGILSTWRFPPTEGPRYTKTTIMNITFAAIMALSCIANYCLLRWMQNKKELNRDKLLSPYVTDQDPNGGERAWIELGDKHPDFKYTL
ncbi:major facilitator superfamily domain-containing protein [Coprinopsis sp. MPI-PUGE-AT-0042]|nr:major facilitator superfamily domain-containing protein [Coprinopsis sp. MPI-PUGE-AT-0042]